MKKWEIFNGLFFNWLYCFSRDIISQIIQLLI